MSHPYVKKDTEGNKLRARAHKMASGKSGDNYVPKTAREPTKNKWADVPRKARGGEVGHKFPRMEHGAGSGPGREEKIEKYGKKSY